MRNLNEHVRYITDNHDGTEFDRLCILYRNQSLMKSHSRKQYKKAINQIMDVVTANKDRSEKHAETYALFTNILLTHALKGETKHGRAATK